MNIITLVGNLTKDPIIRTTGSGLEVTNFSIAVNRPNTSADNRITDFFDIVVWGNFAKTCAKYLVKGNKVAVSGKLTTRTYESRDGEKVKAYEIVADSVEFLTPKPQENGETISATRTRETPREAVQTRLTEITDNQLPF